MQQNQWPKIIICEREGGEWDGAAMQAAHLRCGGGIMRNGDGGNGKLHDILTKNGRTDGRTAMCSGFHCTRTLLHARARSAEQRISLRKKIAMADGWKEGTILFLPSFYLPQSIHSPHNDTTLL